MKIQAAPGLKVPRDDNPRKYITDSAPVEIEMTGYYIRRMSSGELIEVKTTTTKTTTDTSKKD